MKVETLKLAQIKPYANNPRVNEKAVDAVAASIEEFGFLQPIVVDADNVIVAGHTRYLAAKKLNRVDVPIVRVDDLTEDQVRAYRIADNRTAQNASWDFPLLKEELLALQHNEFELGLTAFTPSELDKILGKIELPTKKDLMFNQKYEIVVECADEAEQETVYQLLESQGYKCRVLTL